MYLFDQALIKTWELLILNCQIHSLLREFQKSRPVTVCNRQQVVAVFEMETIRGCQKVVKPV